MVCHIVKMFAVICRSFIPKDINAALFEMGGGHLGWVHIRRGPTLWGE